MCCELQVFLFYLRFIHFLGLWSVCCTERFCLPGLRVTTITIPSPSRSTHLQQIMAKCTLHELFYLFYDMMVKPTLSEYNLPVRHIFKVARPRVVSCLPWQRSRSYYIFLHCWHIWAGEYVYQIWTLYLIWFVSKELKCQGWHLGEC